MNDTEKRIADLKAKLARREGAPEYAENCEHLRAEIAALEVQAE